MRNRDGSRSLALIWSALGVLATVTVVNAEIVTIAPSKDNTLYEDPNGALSNGIGEYVFAGRTGITTNVLRRAVLAFDVAGNVPGGATIDSATLTLHMSRAAFGATPQSFELKRLLADWGEGTSDGSFQEGGGAPSTAGDATWRHTFFATQFWTTDGGEFVGTASATQSVAGTIGFFSWGPTLQLAADVQSWLDDPGGNFGWILTGNEGQLQSARRFDSRENLQATFRPMLTIEYTAGSTSGAGRVPDGDVTPGAPLTVSLEGTGEITLAWSVSCQIGDDDYTVYEGILGDFTSHVSRVCSTGGATSLTIAPSGVGSYYLVVPRNADVEGSYGTDSSETERPPATSPCLAQSIATCG
jgi:collagen type I/II/III/V/XI/XXIV/XXVII alpha